MQRLTLSKLKVLAALLVSSATLATTMFVAMPSSSASETTFCRLIFTFRMTVPTSASLTTWHSWAKEELSYYEKLEAAAPNGSSKTVLQGVVTILKYYEGAASYAKIIAFEDKNRAAWLHDTKVLAAAIESCAKSLG